MQLSFHGGAGGVTGSNYLLEVRGLKILVDCGLFQGSREVEKLNLSGFAFDPASIDYVVLTHAHIDHSGRIPLLYKLGFRGTVVTTPATTDLCRVMLQDSAHIQEMEAGWANRKRQRSGHETVQPLYTLADAQEACKSFKSAPYGRRTELADGVEVIFHDAGHILGSAAVEFKINNGRGLETLVFSGDLGVEDRPILRAPEVLDGCDFLVVESTYGDRLHEDHSENLEKLREIIKQVAASGGNLIIPAFSVGRTQELLYYLNGFYESKSTPRLPVFIDSPLASEATKIFTAHPECFDRETQGLIKAGDDPFSFEGLRFTATAEESMALNQLTGGAIIIAGAGMAQAGRVRHHLKHNLWRPESAILFVGYQAEATLGRIITGGAKKVKLFGEEVVIRAQVHSLSGFSAHADQAGIMEWIGKMRQKPRHVYVTHGEVEASRVLAAKIYRELGLEAWVPLLGDTVTLGEAPVAPVKRPPVELETWVDLEKELGGLAGVLTRAQNDLKSGKTWRFSRLLTQDGDLLNRIKELRETLETR